MRTLALGFFYSHISTRTFRRAVTASLDSCAETEYPFSGVTKSGRVWRKVPESGAGSVGPYLPNSVFLAVADGLFGLFGIYRSLPVVCWLSVALRPQNP